MQRMNYVLKCKIWKPKYKDEVGTNDIKYYLLGVLYEFWNSKHRYVQSCMNLEVRITNYGAWNLPYE